MSSDNDLLGFVAAVSGDAFLKVEESLGDGFVRLRVAEADRRQAKHDIRSVEDVIIELLRNSRDAHAQRIFVATTREGDSRSLAVIDDGVGVPAGLAERVFEPRVTSKLETMTIDTWGVHGRGMALYSIRENTSRAVIASSGPHKGAAVLIETDATKLAERSDQSTWPKVEVGESGSPEVARGPHNLIRRVVEFALEHPGVDVYFGSPSEVLATLVMLARFEMDEADLMFCEETERLPVWQRPGSASDAADLVSIGDSLGLTVSERTAHRVLAGSIVPLRTVSAMVSKSAPSSPSGPDIYRDRRGLKIDPGDLNAFRAELEKAFDRIGERYYLHLRGAPRITVGREDIRVRFEVDKED